MKNVKVTRATTLSTSTTSLAFGDVNKGASKELNASITYNNTTYNQQVTGVCKDGSGNTLSDFTVTATTIGETGTTNIKVTFTPTRIGTQSGTCTLSTTNGKSVSFSVSGTGLPVFKFSATANKIYDHGTVTATVTDSQIVGGVDDTQKSTTATFTATTNNSTFEGWYYDAAHTNLASTEATYTPTITNSAEGTTANLTLYAWFKANQTLTWTNPDVMNIVNGMTVSGAAAATASSGLTVTYESSADNIASVNANGDVTGVSASVNDVSITATQAGNDEYNPVSATRDFHVINKYEATFTPSGFTGTTPTLHVGDAPTITCANTASDFTFISSDPSVVSIAKSGDVITLTALKVGTSTITLRQPDNSTHSAATATYTITVAKVENTLAVSLASQVAQVDGTINVSFADRNNADTPIAGTVTEQVLSSTVNNGTEVITYADGVITAKNAGTAKITFTQAETDTYAGYTSSTYDITVSKYRNAITVTLNGGTATNIRLRYNETATLAYTSTNADTSPVVTRASGSYTTLSGSTITAGTAAGTDVYEIIQAETYKYEVGYATFSIRVNNTDEATSYVLYENAKHDWGTINANGYVSATFSGPADMLSFQAYRNGVDYFYIWYSTDGGDNWTEWLNPNIGTGDYHDYSYALPSENVTNVKFGTKTGATLHKYMNNIFVTRKTYVRASSNKTAFGTVYTDASPKPTATFTVNYSSTNGGNINVSSNNPHFVPSVSYLPVESNKTATGHNNVTYICGVDGTQTFSVTYTPDPGHLGEESAVITIGDLFYSQQITLTATAAKHANTLAVVGAQDLMVDDEVSPVYSSKNSAATLNYSLSRDGVITYDPSTNKITAVGAGSATLTLTQAENDYHYGVSKTVAVTVSKYDQTLTWDNELSGDDRTLNVGDALATNTATASSGLAVTYSSSNANALEVNAATGALTALAGGSNIAITATQAGNYKYNEASITRYFTVIQKEDAVVTTTLVEGSTNTFAIGSPDITITCNATLTASALEISGDEGTVGVSFTGNTFTLTAQQPGTVTITLTRAGDEGYNAISKTYLIEVVNPDLVLDPTEVPTISYDEYRNVTLVRTLRAGYSTIALPFDTDVVELTGRTDEGDWVAQLSTVTYNSEDGYTLFFNKVDDGIINANEPYILHLGTEVVNPTWTDISVESATSQTIAASAGYGTGVGAAESYSSWLMTSNFEAGFSMSGLFGIVNAEGGLKMGAAGATLNAFTAYITPPTGIAGVKLRSAFVDSDGHADYIEGVPSDDVAPSAIYTLDGVRRQKMGHGIHLVRMPDGTVRKIFQ